MRFLISVAAATALVAGFASAASAKTLIYCSEAAPEGFDPAPYATGATFDASSQLFYNRLVEFAPGTTNVVSGLAESWDISADGKQYTFHLRQGVKFQTTAYFTPKRDLTADDVVFSLTRQADRKNPWFNYAGGVWPYYDSMGMDGLIKAVEKVDAATVRITLIRADSGLLADLAMDFASILSREYADGLLKAKQPGLLNTQPVGTGPYEFTRYDSGSRLYAAANRDYWRGAPKLDTIVFSVTPDPAERLAKLKSGACQVMAAPDAPALTAAKADAGFAVATTTSTDVAYLAFNTSVAPFNDARVRKALGTAINREAIVDTIYGGGTAEAAIGLVPRTMAGYDASVAGDVYDVDAAKQLLAAAGVGGLKVKLLATKAPRPYSPDLAWTGNMIAADFAKVGVEATVEAPDSLADYLRQSADKKRDGAVLIGWTSANGDAGALLSLLLSCDAVGKSNRSEWCDPAFSDLLARARASTDPAEQASLIAQAQKMVSDEAPLTAIAHTLVAVPMSKAVAGYAADPLGRHNFDGVDLVD